MLLPERDQYLRIPLQYPFGLGGAVLPGGLAFVDVADDAASPDVLAGYLRSMPLGAFATCESVIFRSVGKDDDELSSLLNAYAEMLASLQITAHLGIINFTRGFDLVIKWHSRTFDKTRDEALMARARAAEMKALIAKGDALWRPSDYHYKLPSGKHSSTFIRLADVFQDLRAATAIATWLLPALDPDQATHVVVDVGTLMPIVRELELMSQNSTPGVGKILALDRYPANALGLQRSLLPLDPDNPILGIVSVSDSGSFAERLLAGFTAFGASSVHVEQLVSRRGMPATAVSPESRRDRRGGVPEDPWVHFAGSQTYENTSVCPICKDPFQARIIQVNPRAMSTMVVPDPDRVVLDIFEARRNASLWELYDALMARGEICVGLNGKTDTRASESLSRYEPSGVVFEPTALLKEQPASVLEARLAELRKSPVRREGDDTDRVILEKVEAATDSESACSLVIFDVDDRQQFDSEQWDNLVAAIVDNGFALSNADWIAVAQIEESAQEQFENVLIFNAGLRSGVTLQRAFLRARGAWPDATFQGVVIHAHPSSSESWRSIENSFTDSIGRRRLFAFWLTFLPTSSPILEELELLISASISNNNPTLTNRIRAIVQGLEPEELLWGRKNPHIEPHSYLGDQLGAGATLLAAGSAMQKSRLTARRPAQPQWTQFDLRRIFRSYFDGLIHVAALRWCSPQEAYWAESEELATEFFEELERVDFDFELLLPELLLAAALEKVPLRAAERLAERARITLRTADIDERTSEFLELGIELVEYAIKLDVTQR